MNDNQHKEMMKKLDQMHMRQVQDNMEQLKQREILEYGTLARSEAENSYTEPYVAVGMILMALAICVGGILYMMGIV